MRKFSSLFVISTACVSALSIAACAGKFGEKNTPRDPDPPGPRPDYGATVLAAKTPPPISGGTLHLMNDRLHAVASDADRDRVSIVGLVDESLVQVALNPGDEPGRVTEDAAGTVYVVLRSGGAVAAIDPVHGKVLARHSVCPVPRGIDFDPTTNTVYVACMGGEIASITTDAAGNTTVSSKFIKDDTGAVVRDLRDVVATGANLVVSTFRTATVVVLTKPALSFLSVTLPSGMPTNSVGWRMRGDLSGEISMVHQDVVDPSAPVSTAPGGYTQGEGGVKDGVGTGSSLGGDVVPSPKDFCRTSIVHSSFSQLFGGVSFNLSTVVLPVDFALAPMSGEMVVVAAGNAKNAGLSTLVRVSQKNFGCVVESQFMPIAQPAGTPVAVEFDPSGRLVVQTREPAAILLYPSDFSAPKSFAIADDSRADTGHDIFFSNAGGFIACASCHPDALDDGRTWNFDDVGARRTQTFRGGLLATAPFHWDGALADVHALTSMVLSKRMSGPSLADDQVDALSRWLEALPALPKPAVADAAQVERGRVAFESAALACKSCHSGATLTSNQSQDVGTGGAFQVPSLRGLAYRAPYMHNGCAKTLADRFTVECGGNNHGGAVSGAVRDDLIAYLQTL